MKTFNFENLKTYLLSHDLHFGVHCTDIKNYSSIKQFGIAHSGKADSTINFSIRDIDNIKNFSHKQANCAVIVAIPKQIFNVLYQDCKNNNKNVYEADFFCEIAPKKANLPEPFVINPIYILGVFNQSTNQFTVNENFICEQQNFEALINSEINKLTDKKNFNC